MRSAPVAVTSITNASPAVVNATAHGLSVNSPVVFTTHPAADHRIKAALAEVRNQRFLAAEPVHIRMEA